MAEVFKYCAACCCIVTALAGAILVWVLVVTPFKIFGVGPFTVWNYYIPYFSCRAAGFKGDEQLQAWYQQQSNDNGATGTLGPGTTMYYEWKTCKAKFETMGQKQASGQMKRANELGMQIASTAMWPGIPGRIVTGFLNEQQAFARPWLAQVWDGAQQPENISCDGSRCWNEKWLRSWFRDQLSSMDELTDSDPQWLVQIVLQKILLDKNITEEDAKSFVTFSAHYLEAIIIPIGVAENPIVHATQIQSVLKVKEAELLKMKAAIRSKWPEGPWEDDEKFDIIASSFLDSLALAGGVSVPQMLQRMIAVTYNPGNPSLAMVHLTPNDIQKNESLLKDFMWEALRMWPPVSTVPFWTTDDDGNTWQHSSPQLRMALTDPDVFPDPLKFQLGRPGLNSRNNSLSIGWADFAIVDGNASNPYSHACPGKWLSQAIIVTFMQALLEAGPWTKNLDALQNTVVNTYTVSPYKLTKGVQPVATPDMVPGILTGFVMMITCIGGLTFVFTRQCITAVNWSVTQLYDEMDKVFQYFLFLFISLLACGAVMTFGFSGIEINDNAMTNWYGYNNECILFDYPPANYVLPIWWGFVLVPAIAYLILFTISVHSNPYLPRTLRLVILCLMPVVASSFAVFSIVFAVHPYDDMLVHSGGFAGLIGAQPLLLSLRLTVAAYDGTSKNALPWWKVGYVIFWVIVSITYLAFIVHALANGPFGYWSPVAMRIVDYLWLACLFGAPFAVHDYAWPSNGITYYSMSSSA